MVQAKWLINLLIPLALVVCAGCDENQQRHFETLSAANRERMVEKGWIPTFTSASATDIDVDGDLDSASVYGSYRSNDTALLRKHCSSTEDSFRVTGYGPKWFSSDVREAETAGKLRRKGYEVFRCDEGNFAVVVLSSRRFVYYWSVRRD